MAQNMSFLPEDYLERRVARRTNIVCLTLFAVVMAGVVTTFFVTSRQRAEIQTLHAEVNNRFAEAARKLEQLEELQARKKQMLRKAQVTSVLVERVPRTFLMAELINHMPAPLSLLDMELGTKVLRQTPKPLTAMQRRQQQIKDEQESQIEVPETRVTLRLVGVAPTDVQVAQFMTALSKHNLFEDLTLQYSEQTEIEEREMRKFGVEMTLNQNIDLHEVEPTRVRRELKQNPMGGSIQVNAKGDLVVPQTSVVPASDAKD